MSDTSESSMVAAIEQVIHARRQQQLVLAVQAFVVGRAVAPRLAVARDQMLRPIDPGDAAGALDNRNPPIVVLNM